MVEVTMQRDELKEETGPHFILILFDVVSWPLVIKVDYTIVICGTCREVIHECTAVYKVCRSEEL
jgi:hypothetical protein